MEGRTAPEGDAEFDGDDDANRGDIGGDGGDGGKPSGKGGGRAMPTPKGMRWAARTMTTDGTNKGETAAHQTRTRRTPIHPRGIWICWYR